ncbi:MHC class II regulatory factor RFX1-like isoform X4 [Tachyglossus aculeatus]|uniref:MHC class II regulatory factor RFX1-like isoform X4 n=1 Tax=Tachyglossus aculeatus TaxID=9261 RepID=UPI0018F5BA6B|nr:MHC class II regulatory factor RFX1-like isoform X4 [Tachyglossus aculeatus]
MMGSDTLHKSSPSSTASQSEVPMQVIQQVQVMQQHLVVQNAAQLSKGDQKLSLADDSMQEMSRTPEVQQLQQEPVQHVYSNQVQFMEDVAASYTASTENRMVTNSSAMGRGGSCDRIEAGTYVIQGGFIPDRSIQPYSHTTRAPPATVQWLQDNYETAEGESLPHSTLYCHYLLHCQEQKLEPVNSASLGKLIRCVFMGLRTRRLGTRGNSKYHYYGLRIKASSPLPRLTGDQKQIAMQGQPFSQKQGLKPIQTVDRLISGVAECQQQESGLSDINSQIQQCQHFLGHYQHDNQPEVHPAGVLMENVLEIQSCPAQGGSFHGNVATASTFAQTLRRYTSLNHLAQGARGVLQNTVQINQMLNDLNHVDFADIQEQASWVGHCENSIVQQLEQDFKVTLQQQYSLEQWASWLDCVVSQVLKPYEGSPSFPKAAKLFILKWSFYSSLVIRDLTLHGAASFGSFHLIWLFCDEYMYYLIEHRVAQDRSKTPIAIMGEFTSLACSLNHLDPEKKDEEEEEEVENIGDLAQEISSDFSESTPLHSESLEPATKLLRIDGEAIFLQSCFLTK